MIYKGYITEVPLPCMRLGLYAMKRLTLSLEEGRPPGRKGENQLVKVFQVQDQPQEEN
jgi:hypothetical protein